MASAIVQECIIDGGITYPMNSAGFEKSYLGKLRKFVGTKKIITNGAIGAIIDDEGRVLLIRRRDNNIWALPGGAMELDESIYDCLVHEFKEETGLDVLSATPVAIYSEPRFSSIHQPSGNQYQPIVLFFQINEWTGTVVQETDETVDARFFPLDTLPDLTPRDRECIQDLMNFNGQFIVK